MALIFRQIKISYWMREDGRPLPADAIRSMEPDGNSLSVYLVDDELQEAAYLVAALTLNRDSCEVFDFAVARSSVLTDIGISSEATLGKTKDEEVNRNHLNLTGLSLDHLSALTHAFDAQRHRWPAKDVGKAMKDSLEESRFERSELKPAMERRLIGWGYLPN